MFMTAYNLAKLADPTTRRHPGDAVASCRPHRRVRAMTFQHAGARRTCRPVGARAARQCTVIRAATVCFDDCGSEAEPDSVIVKIASRRLCRAPLRLDQGGFHDHDHS
jgi:hypothetical protein